MGLSADKKAGLHKARMLYPQCDLRLEKHEGRAEALLLARWYLESKGAPVPQPTPVTNLQTDQVTLI
jgi:hypothetical protein